MAGLLQGVLPGGRIWHTTSLERTRGDATPARGWERGIGAQRGLARRWWLCAWVGWKGREGKHSGYISRLLQGSLCVEGLLLLVDRPERARYPSNSREHGLGCKKGRTDRE